MTIGLKMFGQRYSDTLSPSSSAAIESSSTSRMGSSKKGERGNNGVSANLFLDSEPLSLFNTTPRNVTYFLQQVEPLGHFYKYAVKEMIRDGKHPLTLAYIVSLYWLLWWDIAFVWFLPQLILGAWCFRCYFIVKGRARSSSSFYELSASGKRLSIHSLPSPPVQPSVSLQDYGWMDIVRESIIYKSILGKSSGSSLLDQFWIKGPGSLMESDIVFGAVTKEWHSRISDEYSSPDNGSIKTPFFSSASSTLKRNTVDLDSILLLLQLGQNSMGLAALFLDNSYQVLDSLDWTIPLQTMARILDISLSLIPAYLAFRLVNFRLLFFIIGTAPILWMLFRHAYIRFAPLKIFFHVWGRIAKYWFYKGQSTLQSRRIVLKRSNQHGIGEAFVLGPGNVIYRSIECYENQRWWLGLSWQPHMFTSERPVYSNDNGDLYCPSEAFKESCRGWRKIHWDDFPGHDEDEDDEGGEKNESESSGNCKTEFLEPFGEWQYGDTDWSSMQRYASPLSVVRRRKLRLLYEMNWSEITVTELLYLAAIMKELSTKPSNKID